MKTVVRLHEKYRLPEWEQWMAELPRKAAEIPAAQLLQNGRNRVFWIEHQGRKLVVKHFLNSGPWKKFVYRIWSGKARRSFDNSLALIGAGLHSPEPIGWREDWDAGFLKESFYVCAHVEATRSAKAIRQINDRDWRPQVTMVAQTIARMHNAGFLHRDLSGGNLLFSGNELSELYIIDTNRMSFGKIDTRKGIKSLLQPKIEGEYLRPYVTAYAHARGYDADTCISLYESLIGGHKLKWKIKNATRPWRRKIGL